MELNKILKRGAYHMSIFIEKEGEYYFADIAGFSGMYPGFMDYNAECMIFRCDSEGNVEDWSEVYCDRTDDFSESELMRCVSEFLNE